MQNSRSPHVGSFALTRICWCVVAMLCLAGCKSVVNPVSGKTEMATMDEGDEIAYGRQQHEAILAEYSRLENPALQSYVDGVVQRIAPHTHRPNLPWTATVLDSPEVNAFATAGGYVYITRGILAYLDSEEELAGVLGHEMGHITARHVARQDRDQSVAQGLSLLGTLVGAYLGGERGARVGGQVVSGASQVGVLLPHSRDHENQADGLGVEYLDRSGYDPRAMVRVIEVLKLQESFAESESRSGGVARLNRMPAWLATHPANDERLQRTREAAQHFATRATDSGRDRFLRAIDGVTFGESREQGVSRGRQFYHEPLHFTVTRPDGWRFQNERDKLTIVADDQSAAVVVTAARPNGDHEAAIRAMLRPDSGRSESIRINGQAATYFNGVRQGQPIEATVVRVEGNDFLMLPVAKSTQARDQRRAEVLGIMNSIRRLNADDVRRAQPYVLRTVAMPRAGSGSGFAELAKAAPELIHAEAQLRLMNRAYPTGELEAGRLVKSLR